MNQAQVLVVEDETALRVIYERVLQKMGFEVLLAKDGQQAIDLLHVHTPVLIFLDMLLPMVNGLHVLEFISSQPHLRNYAHVVIASSAQDYEQYTSVLPSCQFMLKPILPSQILEVGSQVLSQRA